MLSQIFYDFTDILDLKAWGVEASCRLVLLHQSQRNEHQSCNGSNGDRIVKRNESRLSSS